MNHSSSKMDYTIHQFLQENVVEKGKKYTHTSMGKPAGSYYIEKENLDTFYHLYEKAIHNNVQLHITEKHDIYGPMVIDLDFRYNHEVMTRQHTTSHLEKIIQIYNEAIIDMLIIDKNDEKLNAFVFQRDEIYRINGITKDGIHIIYPKIVTYPEVQYKIRENVLKKIVPILEDLPLTNKAHEIVDKAVIYNNNWLMYGSSKYNPKITLNPYQLVAIYSPKIEMIDIKSYHFDVDNLAHFFSIRDKEEKELIKVKEEKMVEIENIKIKKKITLRKKKSIIVDDFEEIKDLINILNDERADDYTDWLSLGWLLHNIDPDSQELLDLWIEFSKRSSKFKEGYCEKEWSKAKNEGLGLPTLHYWAKRDNAEKHKNIVEKSLNKLVEKSIKTVTHCDIANVLHKLYQYDFKYSNHDWYKFENHVWIKESDGISLRKKISTDLCNVYYKIMSHYNKLQTCNDPSITDEDREEYKNKGKEVLEIVKKLRTTSYKDNILKESKELFHDDDFVKKLDTNNYLIGFRNGIYDLEAGELREGRPDDYVEMNTDIEKIDLEETNEHYQELLHFINTIFVDPEIREYFMLYLASCLQRHNAEEKFRIWTGVGSNGKSKLIELLVGSLGNYAIKFPITLLTGKRAASNACSPELVKAKGKRFGYFEEPSENEKINAGLMKEFTGGDKVYARGLHQEPIEFKPQWKLALLCNDIPEVPPHDNGTWRRMEIVEFKSRFCDKPKEPNEFPIDKALSEKLKHWKEIFMAMLIDKYYIIYKNKGIKVPNDVVKYTTEFKEQCDIYTDFTNEKLENTKDISDFIDLSELYEEFKVWYEEAFSNNKYPSKRDFKKYLGKLITNKNIFTTKGLKGYKFKNKTHEMGSSSLLGDSQIGY